MARQAQNQAQNTYNAASNLTGSSENTAGGLLNTLTPAYQQEITNPQGYSPTTLGAINTASQQSTGGSVAGAVGSGNLIAARNRNAAGFAPAVDKAARDAGKTNSENALGVQIGNANLKQKQTQEGLSGEQGLFNTENNDVLSSLGLQNSSTNAETQAGNSGWFQNTLGAINAITGAGKSAASLGYSPFGGGGGGNGYDGNGYS